MTGRDLSRFVMFGTLDFEWPGEDEDHERVIFREGYFLDRKPGSLHGLDTMYSETGFQSGKSSAGRCVLHSTACPLALSPAPARTMPSAWISSSQA